MARSVSVLCALALAALFLVPAPAARAQAPCSDVVFIGVRGSHEDAEAATQYMGEQVYATYQGFERSARAAGIRVTPVGLDASEYPAVPVFFPDAEQQGNIDTLFIQQIVTTTSASVTAGEASLAYRYGNYIGTTSPCLVLVGYSQGAWVIGDFFYTHDNDQTRARKLARFSAVVLFGDPRFDPTSNVSNGNLEAPGLLRHTDMRLLRVEPLDRTGEYFDGESDRVRSYCSSDDTVCSYPGGLADGFDNLECLREISNLCGHFQYGENGYIGAAVNFLTETVTHGSGSSSGVGGEPDIVSYAEALNNRGVDLQRWCSSVGGGNVVVPTPILQPGAVAMWRCSDGRAVDWAQVCDQQYGDGASEPVMFDRDDAYSVKCRST